MSAVLDRCSVDLGRRVLRLAKIPALHTVVGVDVDLETGLVTWVDRSADGVSRRHRARVSPALVRRALREAAAQAVAS